MTTEELTDLLGKVKDKYILEAETSRNCIKSKKTVNHRPILIAAAAAALLLVGCAAAFLGLENFSMGESPYNDGEQSDMVCISQGKQNTAIQNAQKEWFAFQADYDPDGTFSTNDDQIEEIPDNYEYNYGCYTREMADQLDAIAEKYNLKLLDTRIGFQPNQMPIFLEETGIHTLLREDSKVKITGMTGMFYPPCNFRMMPTLDTGEGRFYSTVQYNDKAYFPPENIFYTNLEQTKQWAHTAPDGTQLLLGLTEDGRGVILADFPDRIISIAIEGSADQPQKPLTEEILQTIVDSFDYSIRPQNMDHQTIQNKLQEAENMEP